MRTNNVMYGAIVAVLCAVLPGSAQTQPSSSDRSTDRFTLPEKI